MGPALLISEEAALHIARNEIQVDQASELYGASTKVINMRPQRYWRSKPSTQIQEIANYL